MAKKPKPSKKLPKFPAGSKLTNYGSTDGADDVISGMGKKKLPKKGK